MAGRLVPGAMVRTSGRLQNHPCLRTALLVGNAVGEARERFAYVLVGPHPSEGAAFALTIGSKLELEPASSEDHVETVARTARLAGGEVRVRLPEKCDMRQPKRVCPNSLNALREGYSLRAPNVASAVFIGDGPILSRDRPQSSGTILIPTYDRPQDQRGDSLRRRSLVKINRVTMTIADYAAATLRNEITIDKTYQRSPEVWPPPARSYLIETILKEYPVPKLTLHQVTDLKSRKTIKKVVDGQQRSMAILDFFNDNLRLSGRLELREAAGRTYSELPDDLQGSFLSYVLVFDQFESASEEDVREYFRRINSYTAPLNAEEQRHARFQGAMKWFIHDLSKDLADSFVALGVLKERSVVRMADSKLLAELVHALIYGVTTTSKSSLDSMYQRFDRGETVPEEDLISESIDQAVDVVLDWPEIHTTALMRTNIFYSLILAIVRVRKAWPTLLPIIGTPKKPAAFGPRALANVLTLAAALDDPDTHEDFKEFTDAAAEKTNVKVQREARILWLVKALLDSSF